MYSTQNDDATYTSYDNVSDTSAFDPNYWSQLDTTEKFYYLGFLIADGYILDSGHHSVVGIDLAIKDYTWIMHYKNQLSINTKLRIRDQRPNRNSVCVSVKKNNKQWVSDLSTYGMIPRKTGKEHLPFHLCKNEKDVSALLLGFHDADCSIYKRKDGYVFSICGNKNICDEVNDVLREYADITPNTVRLNDKAQCNFIYTSRYAAKSDMIKIYDFMYQNKELEHCWLDRKWCKWNAFMLGATRKVVA